MKRSKRSADFLQLYDESKQRQRSNFSVDDYDTLLRQYPSSLSHASTPEGWNRKFNPFCPAQCDRSSGPCEQCLLSGLCMRDFSMVYPSSQDQRNDYALEESQNESFICLDPRALSEGKGLSRRSAKKVHRAHGWIKNMLIRRRSGSDATSMASNSSESFSSLVSEDSLSEDKF